MEPNIFFILIGLFSAISIYMGLRAFKAKNQVEDYYLAGRSLNSTSLILTLMATQVGGGTILGAADKAYECGWLVLYYPLGISLGFFCLAAGLGARFQQMNISTLAEIFEDRYQSPFLRKCASLLSMLSLFLVLIGLGTALRNYLAAILPASDWLVIALWMVLVCYTVLGGLDAVVQTDKLQMLFIIASFSVVASIFFFQETPSFGDIEWKREGVPYKDWLLMPFLFMLIEQDMGQRCFAAKSPRAISVACLAAGISMMLFCSIPIAMGICARKMGLQAIEGQSILLQVVPKLCGPTASSLFALSVLMAIMSTADSLLCSIASNISCDFLQKQGKSSQAVTALLGFLSITLSFYAKDILSIYMLAYELSVSLLAVPILFALFLEKPRKESAFFSMALSLFSFFVWKPGIILTLLLSTFGGILCHKALKIRPLREKLLLRCRKSY